MGANYGSVLGMMRGNQSGAAPVPTQSFDAANILGTAVPQVGDNKARPPYGMGVGTTSVKQVIIVVLALIAIGYLAYHINFEK
jgi:hypothetical protein